MQQHPLDNETAGSLLAGLTGQEATEPRSQQVVPIDRQRRSKKQTQTVEQPVQYEAAPQEYYSEQQLAEQQAAAGQYPTTYTHPKEQPQWEEDRSPRGSVTVSRWRLQLLESVATVSGSTLVFSIVSLSPLGSIFLSLSPQIVLGVMGTAILGIGFLGEIPLPDNLNRSARKATTVMLGVVLGYVFWWAIVSRTPVMVPTPTAPFVAQPSPRL